MSYWKVPCDHQLPLDEETNALRLPCPRRRIQFKIHRFEREALLSVVALAQVVHMEVVALLAHGSSKAARRKATTMSSPSKLCLTDRKSAKQRAKQREAMKDD